ncbi:MAG: hypothetical protein CMB53_04050 [Euryarchaeota archaeon]|nr:hypothetical protein [Euryarchaeota archaeon]|tara:strand:+ start:7715 stop:8017 length:303 start_codon:yes stop_codon:yes gene_type:complete
MSEILLTFSGALVLGSLLVLLNIISAHHPYHKPLPLAASSLTIMGIGLVLSMEASPEGTAALDASRQSLSSAITGLLAISPALFAVLTMLMLRISISRHD